MQPPISLKVNPQQKYTLAKFDRQVPPFAEYVKAQMSTEIEEMVRKEDRKRGAKPPRRIRGQEQSKKTHLFRGIVEAGGQQENMRYVVLTPSKNDEYLVQPIGEWWHYKVWRDYNTLNIDEAEEKMKAKGQDERWMMKKRGEDWEPDDADGIKDDEPGFDVGASDEDDEAAKNKPRGGEDWDFNEKVSDDEGDEGRTQEFGRDLGDDISGDEKDEPKVGEGVVGHTLVDQGNNDDDDLEVEGFSALTEHGKELRKLLKDQEIEDHPEDDELGQNDSDEEDDTDFFGEGGNTLENEDKGEAETEAEKVTGVQQAPDRAKKEKKKKRKEPDGAEEGDPSTNKPSGKKMKHEGNQREITKAEILEVVQAQDTSTAELVKHFQSRLKSKEQKNCFRKLLEASCEVVKRNGQKVLQPRAVKVELKTE